VDLRAFAQERLTKAWSSFMTQKLKPTHEIRLGRIRAAIWINHGVNAG
jgi:hypothetical protein